jgi:hypothetical protein
MAEVNKAKKRQGASGKAKYAAQYGVTFNNKKRALTRHIKTLEAALAAANGEAKTKRLKAAIDDTMRAMLALKLKA